MTGKRISDEGYQSDESPNKKLKFEIEKNQTIEEQLKEFNEKYIVTKIMYDSANGVIYEGNFYERKISDMPKTDLKQLTKFVIIVYQNFSHI